MPPPKLKQFSNTKSGKLKKIPTVAATSPAAPTPDEEQQQFQLELIWCIQQLEQSLSGKTPKQTEDIQKSIRILKSPSQPIVKKRQLMRNAFGDYRSKMQDEERRMSANAGRVQFQAGNAGVVKSQFFRKALIKPSGEEFRFNFKVEELTLNETEKPVEPGPANEPSIAPAVNMFKYAPSDNAFRFNFC